LCRDLKYELFILSTLPVQIVATTKVNLKTLDCVLQHLHVVKHVVKGDGSCLYHSISHQAGFIPNNSQGDEKISSQLRNLITHDVEPSRCSYRKWYAFFAVVKKERKCFK